MKPNQDRLDSDLELLDLASERARQALAQNTQYLVRHAERILKATKQLELLVKELEAAE